MTKRGDARRFAGGRLTHGACRPLIGNDRGEAVSEGSKGSKGGGAAHFVILSGGKRRVLKNGLSENMRTESKDLSAASIYEAMPEGLRVAGFPRIASLPRVGKVASVTSRIGF